MKFFISTLTIFFLCICVQAQNTVGLISYDSNQTTDGYSLFFPHNQGNAFLLNNCGELVHQWEEMNFKPGNGAYLDNSGNIYLCKGNGANSNPTIHAGGAGEKIEKRDWDNNLLWEFTYNTAEYRLHHDIALLPNGNVIAIAWEYKDSLEAIQAGRKPELIADGAVWPDQILEIQVDGPNSGQIVWQWNAWDHLIQDFDATKDNFGVVADNPGKVNINFDTSDGKADWLHANAIDYNEDLDQILISIPTFSEIWIIDHSTTTAEAAGTTGGNSGKGGEIIYRWGNPQAYDNGTDADRKLFYQHDAHWVGLEMDANHVDYGKIALFNNRVGEDFSNAVILEPNFISDAAGYATNGNTYAPADFDWVYNHPDPVKMYSNILSSVQRLPNGNTLIAAGRNGYAFEINANGNVIWEYINPLSGGVPVNQGEPAPTQINLFFAMKKYTADFPGFIGKDLSPIGYMETNPDTGFCDFLIDVEEPSAFTNVKVFPNPTSDKIRIDLADKLNDVSTIEIFDLLGNPIFSINHPNDSLVEIPVDNWANGVYMLSINGVDARKVMIVR